MTQGREQKSGVCIHGALRRQCEACDLAEQVAALEAKCKALEGVAEALEGLLRECSPEPNWPAIRKAHEALAALSAASPRAAEERYCGGTAQEWNAALDACIQRNEALEKVAEAAKFAASWNGDFRAARDKLRHALKALSAAPAQDKCPHGCRDGYLHQIVNGVRTPCPIHGTGSRRLR